MIIDGFDITTKIQEILVDSTFLTSQTPIVVGEYVNDNPTYAASGWIGIYKDRCDYVPNTLGGQDSEGVNVQWGYTGTFVILVQKSSMHSGKMCVEGLEDLTSNVIKAIFSENKLRTLVDQISKVDVDYSFVPAMRDSTPQDYVHFQQALITLELKVDRR